MLIKMSLRNIIRTPKRSVLFFLVISFCIMSMTCGILLNLSSANAKNTLEEQYLCIAHLGRNRTLDPETKIIYNGYSKQEIMKIKEAGGAVAYNLRFDGFTLCTYSLHSVPVYTEQDAADPPESIPLTNSYSAVAINNLNLEDIFVNGKCSVISGGELSEDTYSGKTYEALVPEWMAEELGIKVGDDICMSRKTDKLYYGLYRVTGIYADKTGSVPKEKMPVFFAFNTVSDKFYKLPERVNCRDVCFLLEGKEDMADFVYAVRDLGYNFYSVDILFNNRTHDIIASELSSVCSVTLVILCVLIFANVGLLIFFGSLFIATRVRERGILRSLGMTKNKIALMLAVEMLIITLISSVLLLIISEALCFLYSFTLVFITDGIVYYLIMISLQK